MPRVVRKETNLIANVQVEIDNYRIKKKYIEHFCNQERL